jgi:hypothetical protein
VAHLRSSVGAFMGVAESRSRARRKGGWRAFSQLFQRWFSRFAPLRPCRRLRRLRPLPVLSAMINRPALQAKRHSPSS